MGRPVAHVGASLAAARVTFVRHGRSVGGTQWCRHASRALNTWEVTKRDLQCSPLFRRNLFSGTRVGAWLDAANSTRPPLPFAERGNRRRNRCFPGGCRQHIDRVVLVGSAVECW